jgi:ADP-ribosyl-[dinitrogen reductase] hydrolase
MIDKIKGALFGMAVGDAVGVPVEFKLRNDLKIDPVTTMTGYGTWNQPPGTWSDDSSLAFCLAESLTKGYNLDNIGANFVDWYDHGYWGALHKTFDVGGTTRNAIVRMMNGISPEVSGGTQENENGNGSLMRILPLIFTIRNMDIEERYKKIKEVSSITHAHLRSVLGCFIYMEMALLILNGRDALQAYNEMKSMVTKFCEGRDFNEKELAFFDRVLKNDIGKLDEFSIDSRGHVVSTLEASLWCILNTDNYKDTVLKSVNLGGDTDTTACVAGGMAGMLYGYESIPKEWITAIARSNDIEDLCHRLYKQNE